MSETSPDDRSMPDPDAFVRNLLHERRRLGWRNWLGASLFWAACFIGAAILFIVLTQLNIPNPIAEIVGWALMGLFLLVGLVSIGLYAFSVIEASKDLSGVYDFLDENETRPNSKNDKEDPPS